MQTRIIETDPEHPDANSVEQAAEIIRSGGLVAFPTETVYGLGADALNAAAVLSIFEAKGRPATNPIIVHVADLKGARELAAEWPDTATQLAESFWPGPLTLVVKKSDKVPACVAAGGHTVGIRIPDHPVALALIRASATPLAAPSANRSTELSPTSAQHVMRSLGGRIPIILDAGPTTAGVESTVIDVTETQVHVLRPGIITPGEIEECLNARVIRPRKQEIEAEQVKRSPGAMERHYAPATKLEIVEGSGWGRVNRLLEAGNRVAWLTFGQRDTGEHQRMHVLEMPRDAATYSSCLYRVLHELDEMNLTRIVVELPPETDEWLAILDRLTRARSK